MYVDEKSCNERVTKIINTVVKAEKNILEEVHKIALKITAHEALHEGENRMKEESLKCKNLRIKYMKIGVGIIIPIIIFVLGIILK